NECFEGPIRMVRPFIYESVFLLRFAQSMVIDFLIHQALELLVRAVGGFWIATVKIALAVMRPAHPGEFHPLSYVGQLAARIDLFDVDLTPIRAVSLKPARE